MSRTLALLGVSVISTISVLIRREMAHSMASVKGFYAAGYAIVGSGTGWQAWHGLVFQDPSRCPGHAERRPTVRKDHDPCGIPTGATEPAIGAAIRSPR